MPGLVWNVCVLLLSLLVIGFGASQRHCVIVAFYLSVGLTVLVEHSLLRLALELPVLLAL